MKKSRNKRTVAALVSLLAVAIAVSATLTLLSVYRWDNVAEESYVYIPRGAGYAALLDSLGADGRKLRRVGRFDRIARLNSLDEKVKPGRYRLVPGMSAKQIVDMFLSGSQTPMQLTINNVRTLPQLAGKLGARMEADSTDFAALLLSDSVANRYGYTPETFMSMFIPNTYEVWWTATPSELLDRMKREHDAFWTPERRAGLVRTGMNKTEAVTLASIVAEETRMSDEMPVIAGVYMNRLRKGMPLQADPTVKFALGDFGLRRILYKHLRTDSPYNTYRNKGLPPGPICMPPIAAIDAVLNYAEHDYVYFCAKEDFSGYHSFASTYGEHKRNARRWAAALDRRGIK